MPKISPLAFVDPAARLADDVEVGPFCAVGPHASIGAGTRLMSHVVIDGHTTVGERNVFFPQAVVGTAPQDLKYRGEPTRLEIGNENVVREGVTIHTGTVQGGRVFGGACTRVGDANLLMAYCHIGHDSQVGNGNIIANSCQVAGHVVIGNHVVISAMSGVTAFVSIGDYAYIAGYSRIHFDVPPYVKIGDDDEVRGINVLGMQRGGVTDNDIEQVEFAARKLFWNKEKPFNVALAEYDTLNGINAYVKRLVEFLRRRNEGKHGRYLEGLRTK
jgi:UDP-N-acetylglucosamine acyltransferase